MEDEVYLDDEAQRATMDLLLLTYDLKKIKDKGNLETLKYHNPNNFFNEVHVVESPSSNKGKTKMWDTFTIYHNYIPTSNFNNIVGKFWLFLGYFKMLLKAILVCNKKNIDVIRAQGPYYAGIVGIAAQTITSTPCVVSLHNDYDKRQKIENRYAILNLKKLSEFVERITISKAFKVFVLTSYLKDYAKEHGAERQDIFVLPHKIDIDLFTNRDENSLRKKYGIMEDNIALIFVGRLDKQKDPLTLLKGYRLAKKELPELKLFIIGDGPLKKEMEEYSQEHLDDVTFTGFLPREEVAERMAACDAFVFPTRFEGFGYVFIEAQASGLPIITTDIPQIKDIVDDSNGLLFEEGNSIQLSNQILKLKNKSLRKELAKKSVETANMFESEKLLSREAMVFERIIDEYREED